MRTPKVTALDKEAILDGWAANESARELGRQRKLSPATVKKVVDKAALDGDARATAERTEVPAWQKPGYVPKSRRDDRGYGPGGYKSSGRKGKYA